VEETESILELYFRLEYDEREDTAKCKDICAADNGPIVIAGGGPDQSVMEMQTPRAA